jgi:hypothetical protein
MSTTNIELIVEGARVTYRRKTGTVMAVGFHGTCYFNADSNKQGNDGMELVAVADLSLIEAK